MYTLFNQKTASPSQAGRLFHEPHIHSDSIHKNHPACLKPSLSLEGNVPADGLLFANIVSVFSTDANEANYTLISHYVNVVYYTWTNENYIATNDLSISTARNVIDISGLGSVIRTNQCG